MSGRPESSKSPVSRRTFLRSLGLTAGATLLAACGGAPSAATSGTSAAPPPAESAKQLRFSSYTWSGYEQAMKQVLDMWKKENQGVDIQTEFVGDSYYTKLQTEIA